MLVILTFFRAKPIACGNNFNDVDGKKLSTSKLRNEKQLLSGRRLNQTMTAFVFYHWLTRYDLLNVYIVIVEQYNSGTQNTAATWETVHEHIGCVCLTK